MRANLASLVKRAAAGERIVVTVGGRPVAQLGPIDPVAEPVELEHLVARGLVIAPQRADRPPPDLVVPARAGARIDRLLAEVRG
jgi:prevent-host-death family protein